MHNVNFNCRKRWHEWALTFQVVNGAAPSGNGSISKQNPVPKMMVTVPREIQCLQIREFKDRLVSYGILLS